MDPTRNSRQTAFRTKMRDAGKRQVTVWATDTQAAEIKHILEGKLLPAQASQARLDDLAARETALAEREEKVARLEIFRKLNLTEYELNNKALALDHLQKQLDQRRLELEREEKALAKRTDKEKMSLGERRTKLTEAYTTSTDWRTGEKQVVDTAWSAEQRKKEMADLSRKTRVAANTIRSVMTQFGKHELLSDRERAALDTARHVLDQLANAAGDAKDFVASHAKRIKEAEEARDKTAARWTEKLFDLASAETLVAVTEWNRDTYELKSIRDDVIRDERHYYLNPIRERCMSSIARKIASAMKAGAATDVAAKQVRAEFDAAKPAAIEKHASLIRDLNTVLVAKRLEASNASDKGKER